MKRIISLAVLIVLLATVHVGAQTAVYVQKNALVQNNCQDLKATLDRIHRSDATMRVNRGQFYEALLKNFLTNFNDRLVINDYNNADFATLSDSYRDRLEQFRDNYSTHEKDLDTVIGTDCTKAPGDFYEKLRTAQNSRLIVERDIESLNSIIVSYKDAVVEFQEIYKELESST